MNINVNEYNTVLNGLRQQLELQRAMNHEMRVARDGVMSALSAEVKRHQETKEAAKTLADILAQDARDLDRTILSLKGEATHGPESVAMHVILAHDAERVAEINSLLNNIDNLHEQIKSLKARKRK